MRTGISSALNRNLRTDCDPMTPIRFDHVSKKYRQRHEHEADDDLWALRDVSFECTEGEVLGLVGRNGCGKSTTLKLAAGVTAPTTGSVTTLKPIAPMLELGAGFHPDLTGRDNIRLNGSLLGMGRKLTTAQFDEIVEFAELASHIDTPVKHYSSGMSARLGFAIAVHSTARLLLVDEVLSVGDKLFQQKCLARMMYLREQGTTIMLVSHDDSWIRNFCTRALLFDAGNLLADSNPDDVLRQYDLRLYKTEGESQHGVSIETVEVFGPTENGMEIAEIGQLRGTSLEVRIGFDASGSTVDWVLVARVRREDGVYPAMTIAPQGQAAGVAVLRLDDLKLVVGRYLMEISIEAADSHTVLATQVSQPFFVDGPFDVKRGYDGIIRVIPEWSFRDPA
jgi:ABC-type polysaccharide/polyol phosphate transport system ATPase subunit